jgi:viroplasmin and RNaseH domain-containing protein
MANYKFYAIKQGREPGIVTSWDECENRTQGYSGAEFKGFNDRKRAKSWLNGAGCCTEEEQQNKPNGRSHDPRPEAEGMAEVHIRHGEDETVWFAVHEDSIVASGLEDLPSREVAKKYILVVAVRQHGYRGNLVREESGEITDEIRDCVETSLPRSAAQLS